MFRHSNHFGHHGAEHHHFGRRGGHGGFFGHRGWGGEDGGRRGRRMFESAELRLVLLKLLADQPRHGYDLIRAMEDLTAGAYSPSPGVVYPTLTMLADMGHTREDASDGSRKTYAVTPAGAAYLDERRAEVEALFARLKDLAAERERVDGAPIRRAMGNLRAVLMHRLGREHADAGIIHAVTAILDEAAQKIERL